MMLDAGWRDEAVNHHSVNRNANRVSSHGEPKTCEMLEKSCEKRERGPAGGAGRLLAAGTEASAARRYFTPRSQW
jgi:hypothetical protein